MTIQTTDLLIQKANIQQTKFVEGEIDPAALAPGQLLFKVDKFAFTANNITYALLGDGFNYWQFFPTAEDGWGKVPVWGFGEVIHSNHNGVKEGERFYGYFPLSTHLVVEPAKVTGSTFYDGAAHRRELSPIYNQYTNTATDPAYHPNYEGLQALLRPLFTTSFLIDDFLADNGLFGGQTVILSSASSKTAFGTAFLLHKNRSERPDYQIIGLTSERNTDFVRELGVYDQVLSYQEADQLDSSQSAVFVDIAGNAHLRSQLHHHYQDKLAYSCLVGASHWDSVASSDALPGAEPKVFFAPGQGQKRIKQWGAAEFQMRLGQAWTAFMEPAQQWLTVTEQHGPAAVNDIYHAFVKGNAEPDKGYFLSLVDGAE